MSYKALNAFIFAGSFSIGVMNAGFDLTGVLEISDEMIKQNAFYFKKNYPNIPVILPSEWENDEYLDNLRGEDIDLMCCNCPCSSLSRINRYAAVDGKNNVHFYRLFNIFKHVQPKTFVIENAPTLIKLGFPILKDLVNQLHDLYNFTIIRDIAGHHEVPMKRMRTLVVGWRKDVFHQIPIIEQDIKPQMTVKDCLSSIYDDTTDDDCPKELIPIKSLFKYAIPRLGIIASLATRWNNNEEPCCSDINKIIPNTAFKNILFNVAEKIKKNLGYWDKSAKRMPESATFPSFSGPQQYLHPIQNRTLNIREMKKIMGYPESFDVTDPNKECTVPIRQALAQGVPVNFGKWIAFQIKKALDGKLDSINANIVFQNHSEHKYSVYNIDEFEKMKELCISKNFSKLEK